MPKAMGHRALPCVVLDDRDDRETGEQNKFAGLPRK